MIVRVLRRHFAFVKTREEARRDYFAWREFLHLTAGIGLVVGILYPYVLGVVFTLIALYYFYYVHREYFNPTKRSYYENELLPLMVGDHYLRIGYEIPTDTEIIEDHLKIAKMPEKEAIKELTKREKKARREPWRLVGLSKNLLTRHVWILGATGAGKSSLLMTTFKEFFKLGAGLIYVDGKSDAKLFRKLYSLAEQEGREGSVFCINFLKPEETKFDTNTFQPLASLPPSAQIEFLATLVGDSGGGDMAYWQGRGKALLSPVVYLLYLRKKYWNESYSYETISTALSSSEFSFYTAVIVALSKEVDEKLSKDPRLKGLLQEASRIINPRTIVPSLEKIATYLIQYPHKAEELEMIGYDRAFIEELFRTYNNAVEIYLSTLSAVWPKVVKEVAEKLRFQLKTTGRDVLKASIGEWRLAHSEMLETLDPQLKQTYLNPPEKDVTQHNYAQQQWTKIFSTFERFSHIFGSLEPEIDMLEVIRNNRVLYVLLPALEQDREGAATLGRIVVTAIKAATSKALGGKLEGLTNTQMDIVESRITPQPLGVVVLDEYGAYPVQDIDTLTAQLRSINISLWLATQDYTSARVGGKDETSVKRVWANTLLKVIMKIEDNETKRELEQLMLKDYVATIQRATRLDGSTEEIDFDLSLQQESIISPQVVGKMDKGMSIMVAHGRASYVQVFWADQKPIERLVLNRFQPI